VFEIQEFAKKERGMDDEENFSQKLANLSLVSTNISKILIFCLCCIQPANLKYIGKTLAFT
jgi:hypothetical protein